MVAVTLRVEHDDGVKARHLSVRLKLPAVPRVGERIRVGEFGSYLSVHEVFWDERQVTVDAGTVSENEHPLAALRKHGWTVRSEWTSAARRNDSRSALVGFPTAASVRHD